MANDRIILEDFPPIPRHWPSCFLSCAETICRYKFKTAPFADCHYDYTFHYERQSGGIVRDADGTNLALKFQAIPAEFETVVQRVRETHGIEFQRHFIVSAGEVEAFALQALRSGLALGIIFDWFYVADRREYRRMHVPHYMCLVGVEAGGGSVHLQDQFLGRLVIPGNEFAEFIEYFGQEGRGGVQFLEFGRTANFSEPKSSRLVALERNIRGFLENLRSTDSCHGLAALQAFRDEIGAFIEVERAAPAVFYVPGLWQFSMQRAHFAEALQVVEKAHSEFSIPNRDELLRELQVLYRCWFDLNFEAEAALIANQPRLLANAMARLDPIIEFERAMPDRLEAVLHGLK
jgi:hypothetical protein